MLPAGGCQSTRHSGKPATARYFGANALRTPPLTQGCVWIRPALLLRLFQQINLGSWERRGAFLNEGEVQSKTYNYSHLFSNHMCTALTIFTTWRKRGDGKEHHQLFFISDEVPLSSGGEYVLYLWPVEGSSVAVL